MSSISIIQTLINGKIVSPAIDWQNQTISLAFGSQSIAPQVEQDRFELVLDSAKAVIDHVNNGDIFEKLPYQQIYQQGDNSFVALNGHIDFTDGYEELSPTWSDVERPNRVLVKFIQDESITSFLQQINGVSYGSLVEEGLITSQDYTTIKTVIQKRTNFLEVAMIFVTIYLIQKQIADTIRSVKETVANIIATITGSLTGGVAGAILTVALLIIQVAYALALIAILVKLITQLIELMLPPVVRNQGIKFRTLLEKSCEKFGYTLESNITELDLYHYLPSKPFSNETNILKDLIPKNVAGTVGIPSVSDFGYLINEFWELMKDMFNTKIGVIGNVIHLRNANDEFWIKHGDFKPRESLNFPSKTYNTGDLKRTRSMDFTTDTNDEWTVENRTDAYYEIITKTLNEGEKTSITGIEKISLPFCLPSSKTKPNPVEKLMITLARFADELSKVIVQKSNFAKQIESNRINVLKVSQNDYSKPKIIPLINNQLPPDHRSLLSAKLLMTKYHFGKSFVTDGALGQKVIYNDFEMPFLLSDLQKVLTNGTFTLGDGRIAEFIDLDYSFSKDTATCSISVQEVYTDKLVEIVYEP